MNQFTVLMLLPSLSPGRRCPAPVLTKAPGSTSAGDAGCDVEGGSSEECKAL